MVTSGYIPLDSDESKAAPVHECGGVLGQCWQRADGGRNGGVKPVVVAQVRGGVNGKRKRAVKQVGSSQVEDEERGRLAAEHPDPRQGSQGQQVHWWWQNDDPR